MTTARQMWQAKEDFLQSVFLHALKEAYFSPESELGIKSEPIRHIGIYLNEVPDLIVNTKDFIDPPEENVIGFFDVLGFRGVDDEDGPRPEFMKGLSPEAEETLLSDFELDSGTYLCDADLERLRKNVGRFFGQTVIEDCRARDLLRKGIANNLSVGSFYYRQALLLRKAVVGESQFNLSAQFEVTFAWHDSLEEVNSALWEVSEGFLARPLEEMLTFLGVLKVKKPR